MIAFPPERKQPTNTVASPAFFLLLFSFLSVLNSPAQTGSVRLAWNPDPSAGLAGYRLYQGVASGNYTNLLTVGNHTNTTVSGLTTGVKYFFAVTAYGSNGLESAFSNEINYTPGTNAVPSISPPGIVLTAPSGGTTYTAPANISLAASVTTNGHTINKVQFYNGSSLLAEDTVAPFSFTWSGVGAGNYALSAKLVYDSTNSVSSTSVNASVAAPPSTTVTLAASSGTISSPFIVSNGIVFQTTNTTTAGAGSAVYNFSVSAAGNYLISALVNAPSIAADSLYVNVDATPVDPTMIWDIAVTTNFTTQNVCWRGNTNSSGTPGADQFTPKIFNLTQGSHQLIIFGREPNTQFSTITISPASSSTPPLIALTAPNNNSTYAAPANLTLAASVTPNGHTISKVQFLNNATLLAEATSAPYSFSWNNVGAGNYSLSASAIYDANSTVSSASATIVITNQALPSSISFAASSGTITSPFVVSNGMVLQTSTTGTSGAGTAVYTFTVPTTGDYLISAVVNVPSIAANSFYVNVDATPTDPLMIWDIAVTTNATSQTVCWRGNTNSAGTPGADQFTPKVFNLTQGPHQLIILGREAYTQLGTITISPAAVLPPPWQVMDIGNVGITGNASIAAGFYYVSGAGTLGGSSDSFRFLYQPMTGDGDLRARINTVQNTATNACAGVIIRETLTPGSQYAFLGLSPDGTVRSQLRTATAGASSSTSSGSLAMPNSWARLVRSNNAILGYKSSDGATWNLVSSNLVTMATNIYFGFAAASGSTNALATATFTNVVAIP